MNTKKPDTKKEYAFSGADLVESAREMLETIRAGRAGDLRKTTLELPEPVHKIKPVEVRHIRETLGASQAVFARLLNVPKGTAIAWESGARRPSGAALKLLEIARRHPEMLVA